MHHGQFVGAHDDRSSEAGSLEQELQRERRLPGFPSLGVLPFKAKLDANHILQKATTGEMAPRRRRIEEARK